MAITNNTTVNQERGSQIRALFLIREFISFRVEGKFLKDLKLSLTAKTQVYFSG